MINIQGCLYRSSNNSRWKTLAVLGTRDASKVDAVGDYSMFDARLKQTRHTGLTIWCQKP